MIIDVSKHQGVIDWSKVAPKLDFVVLKASGKVKDPRFDYNAACVSRYGVPMHVFHFLYCKTEEKARKEAKLFSDSVGSYSPLFWVLDVEPAGGVPVKKMQAILDAFEDELRLLRGNDIRIALYIAHELRDKVALDYDRYS